MAQPPPSQQRPINNQRADLKAKCSPLSTTEKFNVCPLCSGVKLKARGTQPVVQVKQAYETSTICSAPVLRT